MVTKGNVLTQRKKLAALLLARDVKLSKAQIAELVGVSRKTIWQWLKGEAFRKLVERESKKELDDVRAVLDNAAFFAALKELELLACGNENVEARVAADILDRTGYAKAKEIDVKLTQANPLEGASIEQIARFAEAIERLETYSPEDREWLASVFPQMGEIQGSGEAELSDGDGGEEAANR